MDSLRTPLNILICEDEAIIALALECAIESMGHKVCAIATTGDGAVAAACRFSPDLVMMDVMLRGPRDGVDAALEIRDRLGIRSLFMTAVDSLTVRRRAAEAGALGFLLKPYRTDELRRVVDSLAPDRLAVSGARPGRGTLGHAGQGLAPGI